MAKRRAAKKSVGTERMYRCTRPDVYQSNCPGRTDVTARQGHYLAAVSAEDAHRMMRERFPQDSHFDVRLYNENL
jgi:hypothetical protein